MFQLGKTIVSEDIIEKDFVCNLNACKGKCCIDGEAGAPLEESELQILLDIYPKVKPFLREEGIKAIEEENEKKARLLYSEIDLNPLIYTSQVY